MTDDLSPIERRLRSLQSPLPAGVRDRVLTRATRGTNRFAGMTVATLVILLTGLGGVAASFAYLKHIRSVVLHAPAASGSPVSSAPLPVFYVDQMDGQSLSGVRHPLVVNWGGQLLGSAAFTTHDGLEAVSPDGSLLIDKTGRVVRSTGAVLTTLDFKERLLQVMWGDDSQHFCAVSTDSSGRLSLELRAEARRDVTVIGRLDGPAQSVALETCSVKSRHIVVANLFTRQEQIWNIDVHSLVRQFTSSQGSRVLSADGLFEAQVDVAVFAHASAPVSPIRIRDLTTGEQVASLPIGEPVAFSFSGANLLIQTAASGSRASAIELIDWRSGKVLWEAPTDSSLSGPVLTDPTTDRMLVTMGQNLRLIIVDSSGVTITVGATGRPLTERQIRSHIP